MKKRKVKKQRSLTSIMVLCFMLVFIPAVGTSLYTQSNTLKTLKAEEAKLLSKLEEEENRKIQLLTRQDYYKSDSYIEQMAREQLGFIKADEIVFKNKAQ